MYTSNSLIDVGCLDGSNTKPTAGEIVKTCKASGSSRNLSANYEQKKNLGVNFIYSLCPFFCLNPTLLPCNFVAAVLLLQPLRNRIHFMLPLLV